MNRDFDQNNCSLPEELYEQAKIIFQKFKGPKDSMLISLQKLPKMLQIMKVSPPDSMMKDYMNTIREMENSKMSFKQFTHYLARASLETEIEEQLKNLFNFIDRQELGSIDAKDFFVFIKQLQGGQRMSEKDVDQLMKEIDLKQIGFLGYEEFLYVLLPK